MTLCSVKSCKSNYTTENNIHFFRFSEELRAQALARTNHIKEFYNKEFCKAAFSAEHSYFVWFPLNDENRLEKWVAAVGKPDWKPKKTSRICSLHFSKSDIIQGMGYQRLYLRKNAVPKNYSSIVAEEEQISIAMLNSKEICNAVDTSKAVNSSETYVLNDSAAKDHNYSKNVNTMIENDRSSTCGTQDPNQSLQKSIYHPDKECEFIQTDSNSVFISHSSINFNTEKKISFDFVDATRKIKKLSKSVENLKLKNKTLQQKIRRYNKRIILFKQMFDHLEQKKLISDDLSQLMRKQISRLTLQINQNNKGRKSNSQHYTDEDI